MDKATAAIICTNLGKEISEQIVASLEREGWNETIGFALLVFDFGPNGHLTFASNVPRPGVLALIDDLRVKLATMETPSSNETRN